MKTYILINSKAIDHLITYVPYEAIYDSCLRIVKKNGERVDLKVGILGYIRKLFNAGEIDDVLALALSKDFPHLLNSKPLQFAKSISETPFTCETRYESKLPSFVLETSVLLEKPENENAVFDKKSQEDILERIEKNQIEKALQLSPAPTDLRKAQIFYDDKVSSTFRDEAIKNSKNTPSSCTFFKLGEVVQITEQYKHIIANVICEFQHEDKNIFLHVSCGNGVKESLLITAENKREILDCKGLFYLIKILDALGGCQGVIRQAKKSFELEQGITFEEYEFSEPANDLLHSDEFKQDEDDLSLYGEFAEEYTLSLHNGSEEYSGLSI